MGNIQEIDLFSALSPESRARYGPALTWRTYGENELVVDIYDSSDDVLFVVSGRVRIVHRAEIGKEVILGERGPGSYFGEMAAIDGLARSANVTALQTSRIATLPSSTFLEVLTHEPEVCRTVLCGLVDGMRSLTRKLSEHAYLTAVERLYCELLRLSRPRKGNADQRSISPPPPAGVGRAHRLTP